MIEHEQLLKFAEDDDDCPVMLYLAKVGTAIDWKETSPEEILYIPESLFGSVGRAFIDKIGVEGYYGQTLLDAQLIEVLCSEREPGEYSEQYIYALLEIRQFVGSALKKVKTHYIAFEGP